MWDTCEIESLTVEGRQPSMWLLQDHISTDKSHDIYTHVHMMVTVLQNKVE